MSGTSLLIESETLFPINFNNHTKMKTSGANLLQWAVGCTVREGMLVVPVLAVKTGISKISTIL